MQKYNQLIPTQDEDYITNDAINAWKLLNKDNNINKKPLKQSTQIPELQFIYSLKTKMSIDDYVDNCDDWLKENSITNSELYLQLELLLGHYV